jgi:energy-coupling factor transporter ATP-binding protein EcfA2
MESNQKVYSIDELNFKQHSFILITSKRASGKSVLVKHLTKKLLDDYDYDFIIMFSDTCHFTQDFDFIGKDFIFKTDVMEDKLDKILKIQEKNVKNNKKVNGLIILDDIKLHSKSKKLMDLSSMGRHFKLTCLLSCQFPKQVVGTIIRNNLDYIIWADQGEIGLRAVFEATHLGMNFKEFKEFTDNNNHDYQFILYDGRVQDRKERLKVIRATEYQNLKLKN